MIAASRLGRLGPRISGAAACVLLLAGCGFAGGPPGTDPELPQMRQQARAALDRWAAAVAAQGPQTFVPVGELTGQIGDWEAAVGDNNKRALYAGMVEGANGLSAERPPDGEITWPDGSTENVHLLSPAEALAALRESGDHSCPDCSPLSITGARLVMAPFETSRGRATVPVWAFAVAGSAAEATRVAIADDLTVQPPPWDPNHAPVGISIDSATRSVNGRTLIVSFVGAPEPASRPCGEDYTAEAVESDLAVVVVVITHRGATAPMVTCDLVGAMRTATVALVQPLGSRAVLEAKEGWPVTVQLQP